ncbi:MAG: hypothetical protein WDZ35_00810 [Crocinitomicaceae bacterium]
MFDFILGLSPGLLVAGLIITFIALVSQMSLYAKAGQPAIAALVPVWNVIVFCKVVGRPPKHSLFIIIPGLVMLGAVIAYWPQINGLFPVYGPEGELLPGPTAWSDVTIPFAIMGAAAIPMIWIGVLMFIEVCDSFGKHKTIDKVLCVLFNGIYILFVLGISDAEYEAPWYAKKKGWEYKIPDPNHKGQKIIVAAGKPIEGSAKSHKKSMQGVVKDEGNTSKDTTSTTKTKSPKKGESQFVKEMVEKYKKKS